MTISADTNVLVRYTMADDPEQAEAARQVMAGEETLCISVTALCEYVWVLRRSYHLTVPDISQALQTLLNAANVRVDRSTVEAGLAMLEKGGDFADGVIACEGQWLGSDKFVTFDQRAAKLLPQIGIPVRYLG